MRITFGSKWPFLDPRAGHTHPPLLHKGSTTFTTVNVVSHDIRPCHTPHQHVCGAVLSAGITDTWWLITVNNCLCDPKLHTFINKCHQENRTLEREGTFWITYIDSTDNSGGYNYLIYPHCPLNYCHPPTTKVYINLSMELGSDAQCNFNRSGTLCGRCQAGFSLSLGSSHCIQCSKWWPAICAIIIVAFFLSGIALVTILLVLNLTVAMGTLNGIIFYANVINANTSTFLPFKTPNYITVVISWLNLELGIDTCLFKGLDTYWKTLLQLAFSNARGAIAAWMFRVLWQALGIVARI